MKIVVMIPARLGSKRIPRKNLRILGGQPLLAYPIKLSKRSAEIDEVIVNSESTILGDLAKNYGAQFYKRPEELGSDTATNQDFTRDFLLNIKCDYVVMVNSTSPLLTQKTLDNFIDLVKTNEFDTILSTLEEQAETFFNGKPLNFDYSKKINSQDLPATEKVVWALTAWRRETFLSYCDDGKCGVFSGKVTTFPIPKDESCDLDTIEDWKIAEGFLKSKEVEMVESFWNDHK